MSHIRPTPLQAAGRAAAYLALTAIALLLMVPMFWMALCAFTPQSELQRAVPMGRTFAAATPALLTNPGALRGWMSTYFTTENFSEPERRTGLFDITAMPASQFEAAPVHWPFFRLLRAATGTEPREGAVVPAGRLILWFENTLFVAAAVTFLSVLLNALAGYGFAKFDFRGRNFLFWMIIATIMIPGQVTVIPLFFIVTSYLGWHDSFAAVILPMAAAPVGIFLMRQYIQSLPGELEDAARIDGCSEPGVFFRVIWPLSKPIIGAWAVFSFVGAWKAFFWPLIITHNQDAFVLEVGLKTLQFSAGPRNIGIVMSAALLASIPMIAFFFAFQKHLTKGLTVGAVKG